MIGQGSLILQRSDGAYCALGPYNDGPTRDAQFENIINTKEYINCQLLIEYKNTSYSLGNLALHGKIALPGYMNVKVGICMIACMKQRKLGLRMGVGK